MISIGSRTRPYERGYFIRVLRTWEQLVMAVTPNENDQSLRDHLLSLLRGGNAHISFDDLIAGFPAESCGQRIEGLPYTAWQVLEHMRIAQWDILEFSRDAKHVSPKWPKGYWPDENETGTDQLWNETVERFRNDLAAFSDLISDPATD